MTEVSQMAGTNWQPVPLANNYISMPAVLVTGPAVSVVQNSLFVPQWWPKSSPVLITPTH